MSEPVRVYLSRVIDTVPALKKVTSNKSLLSKSTESWAHISPLHNLLPRLLSCTNLSLAYPPILCIHSPLHTPLLCTHPVSCTHPPLPCIHHFPCTHSLLSTYSPFAYISPLHTPCLLYTPFSPLHTLSHLYNSLPYTTLSLAQTLSLALFSLAHLPLPCTYPLACILFSSLHTPCLLHILSSPLHTLCLLHTASLSPPPSCSFLNVQIQMIYRKFTVDVNLKSCLTVQSLSFYFYHLACVSNWFLPSDHFGLYCHTVLIIGGIIVPIS